MGAYVNELAADTDIVVFDLRALCKRYTCSTLRIQWTVDKASGSFLKAVRNNHQDPAVSLFVFFWDGHMTEELLRLSILSAEEHQWHLRWQRLNPAPLAGSPDAVPHLEARTHALKDALTAYKTDGYDSDPSPRYVVDFDF